MNTMINTRKIAISWWNSIFLDTKQQLLLNSTIFNKNNRSIDSLTGREIEHIWKYTDDVHTNHCCKHICKYNDSTCSVVNGFKSGIICEDCEWAESDEKIHLMKWLDEKNYITDNWNVIYEEYLKEKQ